MPDLLSPGRKLQTARKKNIAVSGWIVLATRFHLHGLKPNMPTNSAVNRGRGVLAEMGSIAERMIERIYRRSTSGFLLTVMQKDHARTVRLLNGLREYVEQTAEQGNIEQQDQTYRLDETWRRAIRDLGIFGIPPTVKYRIG
jgi:hypothetical protein